MATTESSTQQGTGQLALAPLSAGAAVAVPSTIPTPRDAAGDLPTASPQTAGQPVLESAGGAPSDRSWSTAFGATPLGATPLTAAVAGSTVVVGGSFTSVMAGMPTGTYNRIAAFDGKGWQRLGEGLDGPVLALAVSGRNVYAGGEFAVAGQAAASRLARWDGRRWSDLAGGVTSTSQPWSIAVKALACDGTSLYVGGAFDAVGPQDARVPARGLARLDLATGRWQAIGEGVGHLGAAGEVRALLLDGGRLWVGGYFDTAGPHTTAGLASVELATGTWTAYGDGVTRDGYAGSVASLALGAGGELYAGGSFTAAGTVTASGVVRLQGGAFTSMGGFSYYGQPSTAEVKALAFAGGKLYAGGEFTTAGNAAAARWAVHDGTQWSSPGAGVDNVVRALAAKGTGVVVLGDFAYSGSQRVTGGGIWTGSRWQSFGEGLSYDPYADANVFAVSAVGKGAYVAGYFDQAGALPVGSVARWTGTAWNGLGGGLRNVNALATVYALAQLGPDLYAAGSFATAGKGNAANIARWDGKSWHALGSGLNGKVYTLTVLGGRLYAGGRFAHAGSVSAPGVAAWDPATGTWSPVGNAPGYDQTVFGLTSIYDRYLVIGGEFDAFRQGNTDLVRGLNGMALFDTQATLDPQDPLSGYLAICGVEHARGPGRVRALQVLGGKLYVGGQFDTAGVLEWATTPVAGFAAQHLAVWDFEGDGAWSTPGGTDQPVQALTTLDGRTLLVGGLFRAAGPIAAGGVAELDPTTGSWSTFGSGVGGGLRGVTHVEALAQSAGAGLWVGGTFNTAGGAPSCSLALWTGTVGRT